MEAVWRVQAVGVGGDPQQSFEVGEVGMVADGGHERLAEPDATALREHEQVADPPEGAVVGDDPRGSSGSDPISAADWSSP